MNAAWHKVKLGDVMSQRREMTRIEDMQQYKRCRVQLHARGILLRDIVAGSEIKTKQQQVCQAGEFLVAEIDAKVGGYGVVPDDLDCAIVSGHYFLFAIDGSRLDRRFLDYYSRIEDFSNQVSARGSTNYAAIRPNDVLNYEIPLPPLPEQRRIVARIEELSAKIEEAVRLRDEAIIQAQELLLSTARSALDVVGVATSHLSHWVDDSREGIQTGPFGAQLGSHDFTESGVPLITIGNVQYAGLDNAHLKYVSNEKALQLQRYAVKAGDLLFARMGTVGRCCLVPPESDGWLINYHIIRVALDQSRVDPRYIHWAIRASSEVREYLGTETRGATRQGVNTQIVANLPFRVPSLDRQRAVIFHLESMQKKHTELLRAFDTTRGWLDALSLSTLDAAFSGRL